MPDHSHQPITFNVFLLIIKQAVQGWIDHRASSMGAAIAYYTALSLAPLLLIVIAIAGLVFGHDAAQGAIVTELQGLIGADGAKVVQIILGGAKNLNGGVTSIVIGATILIVGATTVFAELQADLDRIWAVPTEVSSGIFNFFRTRLFSFGILIGVGFLLIVSLAISVALAFVGHLWGGIFGGEAVVIHILDAIVSFAFLTVLFGTIMRFLPTIPIAWSDVWVGASVTSLLFSLGKFAIGLYLGRSTVASSFGAAGAFVVLIVWLYYAAQIFLFGAEFTFQYACVLGSRAKKSR